MAARRFRHSPAPLGPSTPAEIGVLFLIGWSAHLAERAIGGSERRLAELLPYLRDAGVAPVVGTTGPALPEALSIAAASGDVRTVTSIRPWTLPPVMRKQGCDVVLTFGRRALVTALPGRARKMQIIVMQTGLDAGKQSSAHQLLLRSQPLVRGVVCNSRSAYALAVEGYRVPPSRVFVVPSAIDSDWLGPLSEQRMAPGGLVRVAMVGSARSEKNLLHAFQAFAALERVTSANLVVYSADASIHREVAGKAGANAVTFVEDHLVAKEDLDRVDVLLHPSVSESLPRAVIEALARGVAVVAGPLPEFEGLDRPSVIVEPADSDSVAEGLARAARFVLGMPVRRRPPGFQFSTPPEYARDLVRSIREVL